MSFTSLQNLIPRAANKYGIYKTMKAIDVCRKAEKALAEVFKNRTHDLIKPKSYTGMTLNMWVANSAWGQEVILNRQEIMKKINDELGKQLVRSIKVTTRRS